jgi:hypothetical protein
MKNRRITDMDKLRFSSQFLLDILDYVAAQFEPKDIYEFEDLKEWVQNYPPEDVFDESDLDEWAKENGYVKENE